MKKTFFTLVVFLALAVCFSPVGAVAAVTAAGSVPADISAIASDGTYNFLGTGNGKIYKQTVSGGAISATLVGQVQGRITALAIVGTSLYITTSTGKVYYVASASTGVTVTQAAITDNLIVNADINSAAAIDASKIGGGGVSTTEFDYLGTVTSNVQTQITSKQATVTEGSLADSVIVSADIKDNTVANADINSAAAIDASKIGGGGVSTTEFDYLGTVTSDVQTQLNAKQATVTEGSLANLIVTGDIKDNTVTSADLLDSTIEKGKMAASAFAVTILDNVAGPTAAQMYNSLNVVNEAITVTLPTAVAGMSGCVLDRGSAHDVIIDVQGGDTITLLGAVDTAGDGITNAGGSSAGDFACVVAMSANTWVVMQRQGTWAQQ